MALSVDSTEFPAGKRLPENRLFRVSHFPAPYIVRRGMGKVSKHPRRNQRAALAEYRIRRLRYHSGPDPTRLLPVMDRFVLGMDRMALLHGAF